MRRGRPPTEQEVQETGCSPHAYLPPDDIHLCWNGAGHYETWWEVVQRKAKSYGIDDEAWHSFTKLKESAS